jgi:hypothetical protein
MNVPTLDTVTPEKAEADLEQSILRYEQSIGGVGAILTGWVVVAEYVDSDGQPHLAAYSASDMPYWRVDGLLEAAPSAMLYAEEFGDD